MLKVIITIAVLLAIVLIKKIPYIGGNITAGLAVAGILTFILNGNLNVGNWILAWIDGLDRMAWIMCLAAAGSIFAEINTTLGAVDTVIGALKAKFYKSPRALAVSVLFVLCLAGSLMGDAVAASTVIGMLTFGIFASMNLPLHKICCLVVMGASIGSIMPPMTQAIALAATLANTDPDAVMNMGFISVGFVFVVMAIYTCLFLVKKDNVPGANPDIIIFVDNCYGEFTQTQEPCQVGADIAVGSLIKNPGGGIAPTGGYIVGRRDLVELCAYRLNAPGLGKELGCTLETPRDMYLGFYYAPGVVCEAIKTAIYAQCMLELLGKKPIPRYCEDHNDIVTCFDAGTAEALIGFCQGIQAASPVDSYAAPEPSPEPGYTDEVVMASGSFTQGSTIELSCDGPLRAPYTCYLQGGLNFAASRAGVLLAVQKAYFKE